MGTIWAVLDKGETDADCTASGRMTERSDRLIFLTMVVVRSVLRALNVFPHMYSGSLEEGKAVVNEFVLSIKKVYQINL